MVTFHAVFPEAGKYKLWCQFDVVGELLISDFVVEVEDGTAADETPADPHANYPH